MAEWKGIKMDAGRILAETARSVKISMPSKSEYKNYYFWHPKKLIFWTLKNSFCLRYTDEFVFHLKKDGAKLGDVIKQDISAGALETEFAMYPECIPYIHRPKRLKAVHVEADPELVDNE